MGADKDQFDDSFDEEFDDDFMEEFDDEFDDEDLSLDGHSDEDFDDPVEIEDVEPEPVKAETEEDLPAGGEEFFSVNEDLEGETMWDAEEAPTPLNTESKSKGSSAGLIVASAIALAVAGGGYYAFNNMGSGFNIPAMQQQNADLNPVASEESTDDDNSMSYNPIVATLPKPVEILTPMPTTENAGADEDIEIEMMELPQPPVTKNKPLEIPQAELPKPSIPKMAAIMLDKEPAPIVQPVQEMSTPAVTERTQAQEILDIKQSEEYQRAEREIIALKKSLVMANEKVSKLENELSKEQTKPIVKQVDTSGYEQKISTQQDLISLREQEIERLKSQLNALSQKHENLLSEKETIERELMAKNKQISEQKKAITKIVQKPEPKITIHKPAQRTVESDVKWVLRSVQPGVAWLSKKDENEMTRVEVGEVVDGLGTIRSVSIQNGIWVVQGSLGQVTQ